MARKKRTFLEVRLIYFFIKTHLKLYDIKLCPKSNVVSSKHLFWGFHHCKCLLSSNVCWWNRKKNMYRHLILPRTFQHDLTPWYNSKFVGMIIPENNLTVIRLILKFPIVKHNRTLQFISKERLIKVFCKYKNKKKILKVGFHEKKTSYGY